MTLTGKNFEVFAAWCEERGCITPCDSLTCYPCNDLKNEWIQSLINKEAPKVDGVVISEKDAIIIHNVLTTAQTFLMDSTDEMERQSVEWLTAFLAVRGLAPIQERLYKEVQKIDTDALIKTGE